MRRLHFLFALSIPLFFVACTVGLGDRIVPAGDGQGFTGIITFENARTVCETTNLGARLQRVACRVDDGSGLPTVRVAPGVSFNWALTSSSGLDLAPISSCLISPDTLNFTCDVDSSGLPTPLALEVVLAVRGPAEQQKSVTAPVSVEPPGGDNFFGNVSLLLAMTGTAGDSLADLTGRNTISNFGAEIFDTPSKFGNGGGYFSGTGFVGFYGGEDYVEIPSSVGFDFGSGDFTVEMYVFFRAVGSYNRLFNRWDNPLRNWCMVHEVGSWSFAWSTNGSDSNAVSYSHTPQTNRWYHVAASRNGSTISLFLDGVKVGSRGISGAVATSSQNIYVGRLHDGHPIQFVGSLNYVRVTKGVGRYPTDFTPPTPDKF